MTRRRRWLLMLSALALVLAVAGWWIDRQLEPNRLTATVLEKAGAALQLQLGFDGQPEYALKPEPRLLIPNFTASGADGKVFLSARRAQISLPWSTITGGEPVITRIELEQAVLDLPGLRRWLASRPKQPFKLPTLSKGLEVVGGTVTDTSFRLQDLELQLPHLKSGDPAALEAKGKFVRADQAIPFTLSATASTPGLASDLTVQATAQLASAAAGAKLPAPAKLALAAHYSYVEPAFTLDIASLAFQAESPLPSITGKGHLKLDSQLQARFDGVLTSWPKTWPALPQPLAKDGGKLPVQLAYDGKPDLGDPLSLAMTREPTVLEATVRIPELQTWVAAEDRSLIPPLNGKLRTPQLLFDGVELQGVELEVSDGPADGAMP